MATPAQLSARLAALIEELAPSLQAAFLESIREITSQIVLVRVIERLERNDIAGAVEELHVDNAAFRDLDRAILAAYDAGGRATEAGMPRLRDVSGAAIVVRWDARNEGAENYIRRFSAREITELVDDTKLMARNQIVEGYSQGQHPYRIALDLVGRVSRVTGKREGGLLGLTDPQAKYVSGARAKLLSGDPALMREYLTLTRRDKRFDRTALKAIAEGRPLKADEVTRITGRLADSYKLLRGQVVALHETHEAVNAAQLEAWRQGLGKTGYTEDAIEREWQNSGLPNIRHSHVALDGQKVNGLSAPFVSPVTGARMMHPGDTSLGAPITEILGCRCRQLIRMDYTRGVR